MSGVGLVLGAGGLVGQAYHSGILEALENDLGWDPRIADLIVGTSAGALTAALLRTGVSTVDLACWSRGRNWDPSLTLLDQLDHFRSQLPDGNVLNLFRPWHLPGPQLIRHAVSERRSPHLLAMAASVLPSGPTSLLDLMQENPLAWEGSAWPQQLWICATRRADGRRVVFGRHGSPSVPLPHAVAASSAIPSHFSAVIVDDTEYCDGGLYSPTNADLLAELNLDLVIIISPMSGGLGPADTAFRGAARRRLRAEIVGLRKAGKNVVCFEPSRKTARAMGLNPMAKDRADRVVEASFLEGGVTAATPSIRELLVPLRRDTARAA